MKIQENLKEIISQHKNELPIAFLYIQEVEFEEDLNYFIKNSLKSSKHQTKKCLFRSFYCKNYNY